MLILYNTKYREETIYTNWYSFEYRQQGNANINNFTKVLALTRKQHMFLFERVDTFYIPETNNSNTREGSITKSRVNSPTQDCKEGQHIFHEIMKQDKISLTTDRGILTVLQIAGSLKENKTQRTEMGGPITSIR